MRPGEQQSDVVVERGYNAQCGECERTRKREVKADDRKSVEKGLGRAFRKSARTTFAKRISAQ